nr:fibrous sheath CABYR-binding protein-like isoform X2 [Misgurnus anguillicaudatus]XP_055065988.1 fibrous sheath CABYR-binding protein-like isoform X2 [Misgurnus anguillicaudatus]XP_055065989.1 fibrous sheath CABYR-binding protein-like isoform X2 [Misgurnus anguillicaudatus]
MVGCTVLGCSNRSEKGVHMYGYPTDTERRKKWLAEVNRSGQDLNITKDYNNRKICEAHFETDQFVKTRRAKIRLKPDAVPTIFGPCAVVKKRREIAPQCTPEPTKIDHVKQKQHIAADHSYSVKAEKGQSCSSRHGDTVDPSQQQAKELSAACKDAPSQQQAKELSAACKDAPSQQQAKELSAACKDAPSQQQAKELSAACKDAPSQQQAKELSAACKDAPSQQQAKELSAACKDAPSQQQAKELSAACKDAPSQQQAKELSAASRQKDVDDALVDMIIKDSQPFSVVEDEGFRAFVKKLDPAYVLPTRHGLKTMVAARYRRTENLTGSKEIKPVLLKSLNKNS